MVALWMLVWITARNTPLYTSEHFSHLTLPILTSAQNNKLQLQHRCAFVSWLWKGGGGGGGRHDCARGSVSPKWLSLSFCLCECILFSFEPNVDLTDAERVTSQYRPGLDFSELCVWVCVCVRTPAAGHCRTSGMCTWSSERRKSAWTTEWGEREKGGAALTKPSLQCHLILWIPHKRADRGRGGRAGGRLGGGGDFVTWYLIHRGTLKNDLIWIKMHFHVTEYVCLFFLFLMQGEMIEFGSPPNIHKVTTSLNKYFTIFQLIKSKLKCSPQVPRPVFDVLWPMTQNPNYNSILELNYKMKTWNRIRCDSNLLFLTHLSEKYYCIKRMLNLFRSHNIFYDWTIP